MESKSFCKFSVWWFLQVSRSFENTPHITSRGEHVLHPVFLENVKVHKMFSVRCLPFFENVPHITSRRERVLQVVWENFLWDFFKFSFDANHAKHYRTDERQREENLRQQPNSRVWGRHSPTRSPKGQKWATGEFWHRGRILLWQLHRFSPSTLTRTATPCFGHFLRKISKNFFDISSFSLNYCASKGTVWQGFGRKKGQQKIHGV